jgi:5'-3' exonuclease
MDDYSPIKKFYPTKFDIDYEGKYQHHQGIALLPMVDYQLVRKVYKETSKKLNENYPRNKSFKVVEFIRTDKLTSYTNLYDGKELKSLVKIIK